MGLRINRDIASLNALRTIDVNQRRQNQTLERLATGRLINRASDGPAALVVSELLRGELGGLSQAVENTSHAANLVQTADAALGELSELVQTVRQNAVAALNSGALGPDQRRALQSSTDSALQAIDRIAQTTRFASSNLLNGQAAFQNTPLPAGITGVTTRGASVPPGGLQVRVDVQAVATQAQGAAPVGPQAAASTIRVTGAAGTADVGIAAGATTAETAQAIHAASSRTGVQVDPVTGAVTSREVGSDQFVEIQTLSGTFNGPTGRTQGTDAVATVNGAPTSAQGNDLTVDSATFSGEIQLASNAATGAHDFTVTGGGLNFQIGPNASVAAQAAIGIPSVDTGSLGKTGVGTLASLRGGQANDLTRNPSGAIVIADAALAQLQGARASLGSFRGNVLEPAIDSLSVAFENLSASESGIRDLDFAAASADRARDGVLSAAGISVLRQANLNRQGILRLLQQ